METIITIIALLVGIISPILWQRYAVAKVIQGYIQMAIIAAEAAIPDNTENATLAKIDKALEIYIKARGLSAVDDAKEIIAAKAQITSAVNG